MSWQRISHKVAKKCKKKSVGSVHMRLSKIKACVFVRKAHVNKRRFQVTDSYVKCVTDTLSKGFHNGGGFCHVNIVVGCVGSREGIA